jgi:hypothetical protein
VAGQSIPVGIALEGLHLKMPVLTNEITFGAGRVLKPSNKWSVKADKQYSRPFSDQNIILFN